MTSSLEDRLKVHAQRLGFDLVGIAPTQPSFLYASGERYVQDGAAVDEYLHLTPEELEEMIQFPRFTKYGIVRHSPGHHCHLHVRFSCGPNELGQGGVGLWRLTALAGRGAPPNAGQDTGGPHRAAHGQPISALAQWHRVMNRVAYCLRLADGAQWTQIGRAVEPDRVHYGQPGKRLVGELQPDGSLGKLRPAVVARLVGRDQPQLSNLGLQRVGAFDRVDAFGETHHLAHSAARLAGHEVLAYPGT